MEDKKPFSFTTLSAITRHKEDTLKKIREQEEIISNLTKDIFTPPKSPATKGQAIIRMLNIGTTFFEGIMFGIKIMKKIKNIFHLQKTRKAAS